MFNGLINRTRNVSSSLKCVELLESTNSIKSLSISSTNEINTTRYYGSRVDRMKALGAVKSRKPFGGYSKRNDNNNDYDNEINNKQFKKQNNYKNEDYNSNNNNNNNSYKDFKKYNNDYDNNGGTRYKQQRLNERYNNNNDDSSNNNRNVDKKLKYKNNNKNIKLDQDYKNFEQKQQQEKEKEKEEKVEKEEEEEEGEDNDNDDEKIFDIKKLNEEKKKEVNISHIRSVMSIFQRRPNDLIKLYVDHKFYEDNKVELKPLIKYFVQEKKTYKILKNVGDDGVTSEEILRKVSGSIHHGGICAIVKKRFTKTAKEIFDLEIERSKKYLNSTLLPSHSFSSKFKQSKLNKQVQSNLLGSGARPIVILLDGVENPSNIGAIARSSVLFGVESMILVNEFDEKTGAINPYSAESYRTSRGAVEYCNIAEINKRSDAVDCLKEFIENGWEVVVTTSLNSENNGSEGSPTITKLKKNLTLYSNGSNKILGLKPLVLVFGSETKGISKSILKTSTASLSIPGTGLIESLNVSQASSIILAECWRIQGKSLEQPSQERIDNIIKAPLEITPNLLGIKDSDIYNDEISKEQQDKDDLDDFIYEQQQQQQSIDNQFLNEEEYDQQQQQQQQPEQRSNRKGSRKLKSEAKKVARNKKRM